MRLIDWDEWLDKHIPYFEADKLRSRFLNNPPKVILIIYPKDSVRTNAEGSYPKWLLWEELEEKISNTCQCISVPLFLERDTNQQWYWAFWNKQEALITIMRL